MRVGVWIPDKYLTSVKIYFEQVSRRLSSKGVVFVPFGSKDKRPEDVDLYWDPTCTGGKAPNRRFIGAKKPVIATVHGAANFSLALHYTFSGTKGKIKGWFLNLKRKFFWNFFRNKTSQIITVSAFAKKEIVAFLQLPEEKISVIHHGFDQQLFYPLDRKSRNYLLHVSVFQPIKNIDILLKAYAALPESNRLPMLMIVPGYPHKIDIPGVTLINTPQPPALIAEKMSAARAFILPSFRESFGLPVIEAMACGTPVITSKGSACEEVASYAGILCNPNIMEEWKAAMHHISSDDALWEDLHQKSIQRSKDFSWDTCAAKHMDVFRKTSDIGTT
jgi:glycosyltransferase involved in cell wall biosynthesis